MTLAFAVVFLLDLATELGETSLGWRRDFHTTVVSYRVCKLFLIDQYPIACVIQFIILCSVLISGKWMQ
jgi:hypothetical protein